MMIEGAARGDVPARVLLVDDRADNLLALQAVLEPLGHELVAVASGADALVTLLDGQFALVILDVQMPDMDGFETAQLIRKREATRLLPIIFLTAISGQLEHHLTGYRSGAVDYVNKPFDPDILRAKVSVFVELWRRGQVIEDQRRALADQLAAVERLNVELERSNAILDGFAARAAEDLLEPLDTLTGFLEILADRHPDEGDQAGALVARAIALADRQRSRVATLLEYAEMGTASVDAGPLDLAWLVDEVVNRLGPRADGVSVSLLPGSLAGVCGDPVQLVRVVELLVDHAIQHCGARVVTVDARGEGGGALVRVADDGEKLEPDERKALFSPMGDRTDLGLAVCRRIIERHGGTVWATSRDPSGTAVEFTLPGPVVR